MKQFLLLTCALIALIILFVNLGPLILLVACVWLLYVIWKQYVKSKSTGAKIGWVILGLIILSIGLSNIYAVIGLVALYVLYIIYQKWHEEKQSPIDDATDPFINFEEQWKEFSK